MALRLDPHLEAALLNRHGTALCLLGICLSIAGCGPYHLGNRSLYAPDVQTVYVPMFESASFRRHLAERLTEAVIKELELKTPYKAVQTPDADAVLSGRIRGESKRILVETPTDEGRELQVELVCEVSFFDRRGQRLATLEPIPLPPELAQITQTASLVPEVGHSLATAQQAAIARLAEQIVAQLEVPW